MTITPFLLFEGQAEEAMNFYTSVFDNAAIQSIHYHENGQVLHATFTVKGQPIMCIDSTVSHDFTFTPAMSLFVECTSEKEIDQLYNTLSENGLVLMPLGPLPPSKKFGWVNDRFGVSWQLQWK